MNRFGVVVALWLACVGVVWNVVFDRYVATAALEFTREQVVRFQSGEPTTGIHAGFSPRVSDAAWQATLWVSPIVAAGVFASYLAYGARAGKRTGERKR
jgi:hypothetical protein